MLSMFDENTQASDEKLKTYESKLDKLTEMTKNMMDHNQNSDSSLDNMGSPKSQDPNSVVPYNKKSPPLEGGDSAKIGGMWNLKHEISSSKFYEILTNTELNGE